MVFLYHIDGPALPSTQHHWFQGHIRRNSFQWGYGPFSFSRGATLDASQLILDQFQTANVFYSRHMVIVDDQYLSPPW